jgi:peptide-methionine (S)-S-oxide reductase
MLTIMKITILLTTIIAIGCGIATTSASKPDVDIAAVAPTPQRAADSTTGQTETAVFAGGCFWGMEGVFEHVKGVTEVKSGFSGGKKKSPSYDQVSEGDTGHAESVKVTYDPSKVSYTQLLTVFFSVHDPTEKNRQGPDTGTQYRSAVFVMNDDQKKTATDFIAAINNAKIFAKPVATEVTPFDAFYEAEAYHQHYLDNHPTDPYIVYNDLPKIEVLKKKFPDMYVAK